MVDRRLSQQPADAVVTRPRTEIDGGGVHGRSSDGKLGIKVTVAYDGGNADTLRSLLGASAKGSHDLTGWTGDLSLTYAMPLSRGWTVQPTVGLTVVRTVRDQMAEDGDSPLVLPAARERDLTRLPYCRDGY